MVDMENINCKHDWVYANEMLCSYPPQQKKICKKCGRMETETIGYVPKYEDTYEGVVEKWSK